MCVSFLTFSWDCTVIATNEIKHDICNLVVASFPNAATFYMLICTLPFPKLLRGASALLPPLLPRAKPPCLVGAELDGGGEGGGSGSGPE